MDPFFIALFLFLKVVNGNCCGLVALQVPQKFIPSETCSSWPQRLQTHACNGLYSLHLCANSILPSMRARSLPLQVAALGAARALQIAASKSTGDGRVVRRTSPPLVDGPRCGARAAIAGSGQVVVRPPHPTLLAWPGPRLLQSPRRKGRHPWCRAEADDRRRTRPPPASWSLCSNLLIQPRSSVRSFWLQRQFFRSSFWVAAPLISSQSTGSRALPEVHQVAVHLGEKAELWPPGATRPNCRRGK